MCIKTENYNNRTMIKRNECLCLIVPHIYSSNTTKTKAIVAHMYPPEKHLKHPSIHTCPIENK